MRAVGVALLLVLASCHPVAAIERDKQLHFAVGAAVGALIVLADEPDVLPPLMIGAGLALGKEAIDLPAWSWADIAYTMGGTVAGITLGKGVRIVLIKGGVVAVGGW